MQQSQDRPCGALHHQSQTRLNVSRWLGVLVALGVSDARIEKVQVVVGYLTQDQMYLVKVVRQKREFQIAVQPNNDAMVKEEIIAALGLRALNNVVEQRWLERVEDEA